MDQNLSLYHVFNCVAETGNISHAAKELYISQPAVSKAISSLEEQLQITLFIRGSRGVKLTEEGKLLHEHTKHAFDYLRRGEEALKKMANLGMGHLQIGVSSTLCKHLLLPYLNGFVKENPHIKITIDCLSTSHTLKLLDSGALDIGLVVKPENTQTFQFNSLGVIEDIFVATPTYINNLRLRENNKDIFSSANIMLLDQENVSRKHIEDYFKTNNIKPNYILEVSNMDLLIDFAKTSLGVACVIKEFVLPELESGTLIEIPLEVPINKREVGFSYLKNTCLSKPMIKFNEYVKHANAWN